MADNKKEFNYKLYGIFAVVIVAAALIALTLYAYTSRYTALSPEKTAQLYVDTIVQNGDGYNAYKNSLLSYDKKFGDFIRENYIYPEIYENYKPGDSTKGLNGLNDKSLKGENTLNDDGTLQGKVTDKMYPEFVRLITENKGFDNYDLIFKSYISELKKVRKEIFGDDYFDDEAFFKAFEANLSKYGESLTGCEDEFDKNTGVQLKKAVTGSYQTAFGKDYEIKSEAVSSEDAEIPDISEYGIDAEIAEAKTVKVNLTVSGNSVSEDARPLTNGIEITVVRIGHSWYVANKSCNTSALYNIGK
ncbi:MAG: hypothetical protein IJL77_01225 [Clostridia bacterium]|nr:hypothetical protein [Clostridia bacterium]